MTTAVLPDLVERFKALAAPIPPDRIFWRQDGKPMSRNGKNFARFVAYITAQTVQQRLDATFPGDWQLTLDLLPERGNEDGVLEVSLKATLTILGLSRQCVGSGSTYKSAASDAFKRSAVRFGVAAELYDYENLWVQLDGDGKYAKPVEDPAEVYARRYGRKGTGRDGQSVPPLRAGVGEKPPNPAPAAAARKLPASSSALARQAVEDGFPPPLVDTQDDLPF